MTLRGPSPGCSRRPRHSQRPASLAIAAPRHHSPWSDVTAARRRSRPLTAASLATARHHFTRPMPVSLAAARAPRPAITRRGPSFTSHSPRPAEAPSEPRSHHKSESLAAGRSPRHSPRPGHHTLRPLPRHLCRRAGGGPAAAVGEDRGRRGLRLPPDPPHGGGGGFSPGHGRRCRFQRAAGSELCPAVRKLRRPRCVMQV